MEYAMRDWAEAHRLAANGHVADHSRECATQQTGSLYVLESQHTCTSFACGVSTTSDILNYHSSARSLRGLRSDVASLTLLKIRRGEL